MKTTKNYVLNTFLKLTEQTYPYGYETLLVDKMTKCGVFPILDIDKHGNYFYKIGESRTIFASHLDTVSSKYTKVNHIIEDDIIKTDGTTTLGADDKAGVTIMLWMIKNKVPGVYYFFIGEEVGCIGSGDASGVIKDFKGKYDRIISFDRRGTNSVITFQSSRRCCSDEFAHKLSDELNKGDFGLNFRDDNTGIYTDSAEFTKIIPECTNISVGYYNEHSIKENQDIDHLERLALACLDVDWENLPTSRDMNKDESIYSDYKRTSKSFTSNQYGEHDDWYDDDEFDEDFDKDFLEFEGGSKSKSMSWSRDTEDDDCDDWEFKSNKSYFDSGNSKLTDLNDNTILSGHYGSIMNNFLGKIDKDELEIIRSQYLDMTNQNDIDFYKYLIEFINDDNL